MPTAGNKANWSDITALYTKLNTARSKFSFSQITPTNRQGQVAQIEDVTRLNTFVSEMSSNKNLTNIAKPVTVPGRGSLLQPLFLNTLSTTIDAIQNANNFGNSSFGDSSWSFGDTGWSFGNTSFGDTSFSFGNTGFSFGNSSFGDTGFGFGDSGFGFGNSGFGNSSFGNSSFGNTSFSNSGWSFGNSSFGNSSFSNSSWRFGNSSFGNTGWGQSAGGDITFKFAWG
jgi:hypothetical protein